MPILKVYDDTKGRGQCRSCDAPVWWFQLTSGKRHPFDAASPQAGRQAGKTIPESGPVYVRTEREEATARLVGHIDTDVSPSHFATCPQAADWRRK